MYADEDGEMALFLATMLVGIAVGGIIGAVTSYCNTGKVNWKSVAIGAAAGGIVGAAGGAIIAGVSTGAWSASVSSVLLAGSQWAQASSSITSASSNSIGRAFEDWFYKFYNVARNCRQVIVKGIGRIDAFANNSIYELKNYNWAKYTNSQLNSIAKRFVKQAQGYMNIKSINGKSVRDIVFYFSSKPPKNIISSLQNIGAKVRWIP